MPVIILSTDFRMSLEYCLSFEKAVVLSKVLCYKELFQAVNQQKNKIAHPLSKSVCRVLIYSISGGKIRQLD